jgi:hypothetical protein
MFTSNIKRLLD